MTHRLGPERANVQRYNMLMPSPQTPAEPHPRQIFVLVTD